MECHEWAKKKPRDLRGCESFKCHFDSMKRQKYSKLRRSNIMLVVFDINFKAVQRIQSTFLTIEEHLIFTCILVYVLPLESVHITACEKPIKNQVCLYHAACPNTLNFTAGSIPYCRLKSSMASFFILSIT